MMDHRTGERCVTPDTFADMILTNTTIRRSELEAGTGWKFTPEGACKGDVCIPLGGATMPESGELVDVAELAEVMGLPLVQEEGHDVWALGPESIGARALTTSEAADFELPGLDRHVVRDVAGSDLVKEPQAMLGEGER